MAGGDLSTDLSLDMLTPASSVRAIGGNPPKQDSEAKARRQTPEEESREDNLAEPDDHPEHQLDSLA